MLVIEGKFEDTEVFIKHEFKLEEDSIWLDERITMINNGNKKVR